MSGTGRSVSCQKRCLRSSRRGDQCRHLFRSDAGCDPVGAGQKGSTWKRDPLFGRSGGRAGTDDHKGGWQSRNVVPSGDAYIAEITGNHFDGSMPLAKILWLKKNEPEIHEKTACFLISSKDYIIQVVTYQCVCRRHDMCSTAGGHGSGQEDLVGRADWSRRTR